MIEKNRNFFIVYCIGSGFAALMVILNSSIKVAHTLIDMAVQNQAANIAFIIMYAYALALSIFGIYCGLKIANNSPSGRKYLKFYLIPQIPLISIPGFAYYFKMGLDFTTYIILDNSISSILGTHLNFSIGSFFNLNFDEATADNGVLVGVNIVPILLLASLVVAKKLNRRRAKSKGDSNSKSNS